MTSQVTLHCCQCGCGKYGLEIGGGVQRGENGRLISTKGKKKFDLGRNVKIESDFGTALKSHNLRL